MRQRQEVANTVLAQLLQKRGLVAHPEQIIVRPSSETALPDVLIDLQGLRLMIEAEYGPQNKDKALDKAQSRLDQGLAHIGVALVYPAHLRTVPFKELSGVLEAAQLSFVILDEVSATQTQLHLYGVEPKTPVFTAGSVDDLVEGLRRSFERLAKDDVVTEAVKLIQQKVDGVERALAAQPASATRVARVLGTARASEGKRDPEETVRQRHAALTIFSLILVNALAFQEILAQTDTRVHALEGFRGGDRQQARLRDHWEFILEKINYYPIFKIAFDALGCISSDKRVDAALTALVDASQKVVGCKAALRHDLAGRIYHTLLEEAKYLGAYYTSLQAATLLAKLALDPRHSSVNWESAEALSTYRVADLACGTGTLLMAAVEAITDNYVRACVAARQVPQLEELQSSLVAQSVYGLDVLTSAVHLTASTLALRVPDVPVNTTHLYKLALGGTESRLGSLELLTGKGTTGMLFGVPERVGNSREPIMGLPDLDLCIMNPPFTRSVGGNLLFGNFTGPERTVMQKRLQRLVQGGGFECSITAGLGSVFVALADRHLTSDGTIALVLPRALLSGVAWGKTRDLLARSYSITHIVVSHEPDHWNFSENTDLSEVLVVARKRTSDESLPTVMVNLWSQPRSSVEALSVASQVLRDSVPKLENEARDLELGNRKVGEVFTSTLSSTAGELWCYTASFAQARLNRVNELLQGGVLLDLRSGKAIALALRPLGEIAELGLDRRDVHDAFEISRGKTAYPALWGHDSRVRNQLEAKPNQYLRPRSVAEPGRKLRSTERVFGACARLMVAERLRLNTMRVLCVRLDRPGIGNVWWPMRLKDGVRVVEAEKALALWFNCSLGLLIALGRRADTQGAWVDFKKPTLLTMPVLDVGSLTDDQLAALTAAYDELARKPLFSFSAMDDDPMRKAIDDGVAHALSLPDIAPIREALAAEPCVCLSLAKLMPD